MSVSIKQTSRLQLADLLIVDGVEFWDTLVLPDSIARSDDTQHVVIQGDRIDLLAHFYYQNAGLWWVIAWANDLDIVPTDLVEGTVLRIPSLDYINRDLIGSGGRRS